MKMKLLVTTQEENIHMLPLRVYVRILTSIPNEIIV